MAKQWYYYDNTGKKCGPVSASQLKSLAEQGVVNPSTRIANDEGKEAVAEKVKGLFATSSDVPATAPKVASTPSKPPQPKAVQPQVVQSKPSQPKPTQQPTPKAKPAPIPPPPSNVAEQNSFGAPIPQSPFDTAFPQSDMFGNPFDAFPLPQGQNDPFGNIPPATSTSVASGSQPFSAKPIARRSSSSGIGYFDVLKKWNQFSGRARRKEFWMFVLPHFAVSMVLFTIIMALGGVNFDEEAAERGTTLAHIFLFILVTWNITSYLLALTVSVRRLHDVGRSGWWMLMPFLPFVNAIVVLFILFFFIQDSEQGSNKYGASPK